MQQFVDILSDDFFSSVAGHLQQRIIAERSIPSYIQTANALDDGIQDHLQFSLQFTLSALLRLVRWHRNVHTCSIDLTRPSIEEETVRFAH